MKNLSQQIDSPPTKLLKRKGLKPTEVGWIPEDWLLKSLDTICDVRDGTHASPKYHHEGVKFVTSKNIVDGKIDFSDISYISKKDAIEIDRRSKVNKNDILMSMIGTIGNSSLIDFEPDFSIKNVALIKPQNVDANYLAQYLASNGFKFYLKNNLAGGIQKFVSLGVLRGLEIPLPPSAEQRAIATALSDIDELIRSLDALIQKKEAIKKGSMQQLLTGKQRLPGFEGAWEMKRLGELVENIVGGGTPSRSKNEYWDGRIPWATVKDFRTFNKNGTQERITKEGLINSSSNLIPKGTVITSTRMGLGQAVIYNVDVAINQDLKAIYTNKKLFSEYLFYWFSANKEVIKSIGSGSTVKGISLVDLKDFKIFISDSIEEQKAIARILSDMDREIQVLRQKREKAGQIKQGMMEELLKGKTRLV